MNQWFTRLYWYYIDYNTERGANSRQSRLPPYVTTKTQGSLTWPDPSSFELGHYRLQHI